MKITLFALILFALTACGTAGSLAKTSAQSKAVDLIVQSGFPQTEVRTANLTQAELLILDKADGVYSNFRSKWDVDPEALALQMLQLDVDFRGLKAAYLDYKLITLTHYDEYTIITQNKLSNYHSLAQSLDAGVQSLISAGNKRQALATAMQYASLAKNLGLL